MLAEFSAAEGWILGCTIVGAICGLGALVVAIVTINKKQDVKLDQPLSIQLLESFVAKSEFTAHVNDNKQDLERIRAEQKKDRQEMDVHGSMERKSIYNEIGLVRKELSQKIDAMPSRIVADLRNAKGLLE